MARFIAWVERLIERHGDALLRLKGVLDVEGSEMPVVVHGVQHVFHPLSRLDRWPSGGRRSRIVVIVNGLDREQVVEGLDDLLC